MKEIHKLENKDFKIILLEIEPNKYRVTLKPTMGGEFNIIFTNYERANNFFDTMTQGLYAYEQ